MFGRAMKGRIPVIVAARRREGATVPLCGRAEVRRDQRCGAGPAQGLAGTVVKFCGDLGDPLGGVDREVGALPALLLRDLSPQLRNGEWVFVTAARPPDGVAPLASFTEAEGLSLVVRRGQADAAGLPYNVVTAGTTLTVHNAVDAVGLTAVVAGQLAGAGISCNIIAARHHDHLLVPHARAQEALDLLQQLSEP